MTTSLNRFPEEGARSPDSVCAATVDKTGTSGIPSWRHPCDESENDTNKRQVYKGDERIRLTGDESSGAVSQPLWRSVFPL